jgi:hypothetical protein
MYGSVEALVSARQATDDIILRMRSSCRIIRQEYRQALRIFNTY